MISIPRLLQVQLGRRLWRVSLGEHNNTLFDLREDPMPAVVAINTVIDRANQDLYQMDSDVRLMMTRFLDLEDLLRRSPIVAAALDQARDAREVEGALVKDGSGQ